MRVALRIVLCLVTLTLFAPLAPAAAQGGSSWEQIERSGVLRVGVIPARPPYFWQEDGQWVGFSAVMGQDVARALSVAMEKEIHVEFVITSWTSVVLDIQANRLDVFFGLSFAEERRRALHLVGPMYSLPNVAINARNFSPGDTWESYNQANTRVAVVMGTTDEQAARRFLPNAQIRALRGMAEAVLDIQSGNASTMITTVLTGLGALKENRSLGSLTVLRPVQSLPSFGGTRRDSDGRLATFLQGWAFAYRDSGRARSVILEAMNRFGLDTNAIPPEVQF
jgi:polar amino acid transport system substrate-binding protein